MIFHFRLFPGKNIDKIFQKYKKNPIFDTFWAYFWAKHKFPRNSDIMFFLILTMYHCAMYIVPIFFKKLITRFQVTLVSDGQTHSRTSMNL